MILKVLFREYKAWNVIWGLAGSREVAGGSGVNFWNDVRPGVRIELDDGRNVGIVASVESGTSLTLLEPCLFDFSGEVWWSDWTLWRVSSGKLSKRVESENEGEAGVVVFDNVSMEFYFGSTLKVPGIGVYEDGIYDNPVKYRLETDLTDVERFLIRLQAVRYGFDGEEALVTDSGAELVTEVSAYIYVLSPRYVAITIFEGMIDFKTIEREVLNEGGEFSFLVSFSVMDKLAALNVVREIDARARGYIYPDVLSDTDVTAVWVTKPSGSSSIIYGYGIVSGATFIRRPTNAGNSPVAGDIITFYWPVSGGAWQDCWALVTDAYEDTGSNRMLYILCVDPAVGTGSNFNDLGTWRVVPNRELKWISRYYSGHDIFVRTTRSRTFATSWSTTESYTANSVTGIDAIKLIEAIASQAWSDLVILNKMVDADGGTMSELPIALENAWLLLNNTPLDKEPLQAIQYLANAANAYLYFDKAGRLVLQNKYSLTTFSGTARTIDPASIKRLVRKEFWDKLCDSVTVNATSWIPDPDLPGKYLDGAGYAFKVVGMKARNELKRNIIVDMASLERHGFTLNSDGALSYAGLTLQVDMLNKFCDLKATEYLDFYGKRHRCYDLEFSGLQAEILEWTMLDVIEYEGVRYFITSLGLDVDEDEGDAQLVEITGHDYNLGTVVIGVARDEYLTGQ